MKLVRAKTSAINLIRLYNSYQINAKITFYSHNITALYMFLAILCSSSGGHIVYTCSIWYRHSVWVVVVLVRYTGWARNCVESSWNVIAHVDAGGGGKWRGKWRMLWVGSTLHTTSEHGVSSITAADAHTSAASIWLKWRHRRFKWTRPFRRKTKYDFCACAITFQT
jgi:hypothetical protein